MAFYLPLAVSLITHTVAVYMQFERVSAAQRRMLYPGERTTWSCERFAQTFFIREEWLFADERT